MSACIARVVHRGRFAILQKFGAWPPDNFGEGRSWRSGSAIAATQKRARLLTNQKITMDDVKKWRLENTNKEKKTDRKSFNSWVANTRKEEYQVDLFFFQDLKKEAGDERALGREG